MGNTNMSKLEKQIEEMEAKLQEMREELNRKKEWEPKGGRSRITGTGHIIDRESNKSCLDFGTERSTREQAERARDRMRVFNRLLAYVDEYAPDYKPDWNDLKEKKFRIFYDHFSKIWSYTLTYTIETVGTVYMPEDIAEILRNKLNSGEVVL